MFVKNGTAKLQRVLTCPPTYLKMAAPINEISKKYQDQPLDRQKLAAEYQQLLAAYAAAGVEVEQLKPAATMTNSIFARDFSGSAEYIFKETTNQRTKEFISKVK